MESTLKRLNEGRFYRLKGVRVVDNSYGPFGYDGLNNDTHTHFKYMLDDESFRLDGAWEWQIFNSIINISQIRAGGKCK